MMRTALAILMLTVFSGCAAVTAVTAVSGYAVESVANLFQDHEESLLVSMQTSLAASQRSLDTMRLNISVVESLKDGYLLKFGNEKLDGKIRLIQQTTKLTTVQVTVRDGINREDSVERAIILEIKEKAEKIGQKTSFAFNNYNNIREKPSIQSERVGWYRQGSELETNKLRKSDWLLIKMPSGKKAYLKG